MQSRCRSCWRGGREEPKVYEFEREEGNCDDGEHGDIVTEGVELGIAVILRQGSGQKRG